MKRQMSSLAVLALLGALGLTSACDDDDDDPCENGVPSCAAGSYYVEKTCSCERLADAAPAADLK